MYVIRKIIDDKLVYTLDSLGRFKSFTETFDRPYDLVFHYDQASESFLSSQGIKLSGFRPLPIATDTYRPLNLPRTRDILFLGRSTPRRETFLGPLKRDFDVFHVAHGLPSNRQGTDVTRELLPVVSAFKVVLNIHAEAEPSWEPRVQQMLSCRSLVISEPISKNSYYSPGTHYLEADSPETMYEACRQAVAAPADFDHISDAGYEATRARLSASQWFSHLFEEVAAGAFPRATHERGRWRLSSLEMAKRVNGMDHLMHELVYADA